MTPELKVARLKGSMFLARAEKIISSYNIYDDRLVKMDKEGKVKNSK